MSATILIVDDEHILAQTIEYNLRKAGYETVTAFDGEEALAQARYVKPQLITLDVMLPKLSGWEVCRALRQDPENRVTAPILMLTGRGEESDKVIGLELGADDYLVKPFGMREFIARVGALLRRVPSESAADRSTLCAGDVALDVARHEVHWHDAQHENQEIKLPVKEFELLRVLMSYQGRTVPRDTLLERVWGDDFRGDERTLDVHVRWLREKIETNPSQPERILTVRGVGYKFREQS